jgi:hypothetical protein
LIASRLWRLPQDHRADRVQTGGGVLGRTGVVPDRDDVGAFQFDEERLFVHSARRDGKSNGRISVLAGFRHEVGVRARRRNGVDS